MGLPISRMKTPARRNAAAARRFAVRCGSSVAAANSLTDHILAATTRRCLIGMLTASGVSARSARFVYCIASFARGRPAIWLGPAAPAFDRRPPCRWMATVVNQIGIPRGSQREGNRRREGPVQQAGRQTAVGSLPGMTRVFLQREGSRRPPWERACAAKSPGCGEQPAVARLARPRGGSEADLDGSD